MKAFECDGNDILAVYETTLTARELCAGKSEPVLVVAHTYRTSGHSKSDENLYRSADEIAVWEKRCPIERFKNVLLTRNIFTANEISAIDNSTTSAVDSAAQHAKNQPRPDISGALENVYSNGGGQING
jgi:pyruvate dehydrogenase E1 component alpha subunit